MALYAATTLGETDALRDQTWKRGWKSISDQSKIGMGGGVPTQICTRAWSGVEWRMVVRSTDEFGFPKTSLPTRRLHLRSTWTLQCQPRLVYGVLCIVSCAVRNHLSSITPCGAHCCGRGNPHSQLRGRTRCVVLVNAWTVRVVR